MTMLQMTEQQIEARVAQTTKKKLMLARLAAMIEGSCTFLVEYVQAEWAEVPDCGIPQDKSDEVDQLFDDAVAALSALQKALGGV